MARRFYGGYTLLQVVIATTILSIVVTIAVSTILNAQDAVTQSQVRSVIHRRARDGLNRVVRLAGQALTSDPDYLLFQPGNGSEFHCFRFALLESYDTTTGTHTFSSDLAYIYGPHSSPQPNAGLVIARGTSLNSHGVRSRLDSTHPSATELRGALLRAAASMR
ncbi:MAG: type II secretion system protein [bacterium]|nr:type II secretion system protein [bacterium]